MTTRPSAQRPRTTSRRLLAEVSALWFVVSTGTLVILPSVIYLVLMAVAFGASPHHMSRLAAYLVFGAGGLGLLIGCGWLLLEWAVMGHARCYVTGRFVFILSGHPPRCRDHVALRKLGDVRIDPHPFKLPFGPPYHDIIVTYRRNSGRQFVLNSVRDARTVAVELRDAIATARHDARPSRKRRSGSYGTPIGKG
ncbi:MAG TPA: hypothetical protein VFQ88_09485 [Nevskiaceae bacterium]|nr:hypothetical protein [Nevskiaceae bacterium]